MQQGRVVISSFFSPRRPTVAKEPEARVHVSKEKKKKVLPPLVPKAPEKRDNDGALVLSEADDAASAKKRKQRAPTTTFQNKMLAEQRVQEFPDESLYEQDGNLHCAYCGKPVRFREKGDVAQHIYGVAEKGKTAQETFDALKDAGKLKLKHHAKKLLFMREKERRELVKTRRLDHADKLFREFGRGVRGQTIDDEVFADRVLVVTDMMALGIPLSLLRNNRFVQLVVQSHKSLGGSSGVAAVMPMVRQGLMDDLKGAVKDRLVSIVFDGSKVNFSIEAVLARFINDKHEIVSICIGAEAVSGVSSAMMATLLREHMNAAGIEVKNVVGFLSDSGNPNPLTMREWNESANSRFGQQRTDNSVLWIPCLMHAMSNCGMKLRLTLPLVNQFMRGYRGMNHKSDAARRLWAEKTLAPAPGVTEKTFWSWWECAKKILEVWQHVGVFLREATLRKLAEKNVKRMQDVFLVHQHMLKAQMEFCIALGKPFHDAGYELEGDGFCLPMVKKNLLCIKNLGAEFGRDKRAHALITSICARAQNDGMSLGLVDNLGATLNASQSAVFEQYDMAVRKKMETLFPLFIAAGLFEPRSFTEAKARRNMWAEERAAAVVVLASLKGVPQGAALGMDAEMQDYETAVRERVNFMNANPGNELPFDLWQWWIGLRERLPCHFSVARVLVLLQPSSASIERFFSTVKANTVEQQHGETEETLSTRAMAIYNLGKKL